MQTFVTGATGLLGNNLVRELVAQGHSVKALVRSSRKAAEVFGDLPITVVEGDMQDVAAFAPALEGSDVLFHTAAYFREYFQPGDHWQKLEAINIRGTMDLLAQAERRGISKVIYTSSSGVIGLPPGKNIGDETTPPDAFALANLYFKSKVVAEEQIQAFLQRSALPVVLILPAWMFGPSDTAPTSSGQIVLDFLNRRLPGIIQGGGAPVDVRDVAQAMIAAVERGQSGERYIVGGDNFVSFAQLNEILEKHSGVPRPTLRIPYTVSLVYAWFAERYSQLTGKSTLVTLNGVRTLRRVRMTSSAKARRELGATFRPLEETLRDEIAWFRAHRPEKAPGTGTPRSQAAQV